MTSCYANVSYDYYAEPWQALVRQARTGNFDPPCRTWHTPLVRLEMARNMIIVDVPQTSGFCWRVAAALADVGPAGS